MTASEQASINQVKVVQAGMKEHQRSMQNDIDELKHLVRETNAQVTDLNKKFDTLTGGKQALMWITGVAIAVAGLIITYFNFKKR